MNIKYATSLDILVKIFLLSFFGKRSSNVGAATGRQLASHGLKVLLYLEEDSNIEQKSIEISLFKATGNTVVYSVEGEYKIITNLQVF